MTMPRERHDHDVFSSAGSQMAIISVAVVAMLMSSDTRALEAVALDRLF